ncbi:hypothetical protein N7493_005546 [Penicillium malachiteum]|uniref:Pentatricopeptide repeat protein n=1 Tax=Penicillium malachiteum TaxID=1324776 RepID=A0AAD6HNP5_9EURO|nr:hypothetical protein N7493_005546 [Penicillium malachiteum]
MAGPGCIWSRALRSRLLQQQLARSARQTKLSTTLAAQRSYLSTYTDEPREDFRGPRHPRDPRPDFNPGFKRMRRPNRHNQNADRNNSEGAIFSRGFGHKGDDELLMEIAQQKTRATNQKHVRLEMAWLEDPLLLAQRVSSALAAGDPGMAASLAREALRQHPGSKYTVAWNRIMHYCMDRGHPKPALRFFNDMKKRAGKPNPQTFTILLAGLRNAPATPGFNIVRTAEHIYNSISASNSEVDLDIIHTNAMLSVCQYHNDIESLWRIAGNLSEQGSGAPNMMTYTVILGALQFSAREDISKMEATDIDKIFARKSQLMTDAKRIWADILHRWKTDDILPDNRVIGSMAGVLMDGAREQDYYDVFALYNQTMGIPILARPPSQRSKEKPSTRWEIKQRRTTWEAPQEENVPFVDENNRAIKLDKDGRIPKGTPENENSRIEDDEEEENLDAIFDALPTGSVPELRPDSKDLTLIIDACLSMSQGLGPGSQYWNHLTLEDTPHRIQPDSAATMHYLRLLRVSRASKISIRVIRDQMIPSGMVDGKAFHIALTACRRDNRNQSCLVHGNELMDLMNEHLILPDPRALLSYVELVKRLAGLPNILMYLKGLEIDEKKKTRNMLSLGKTLLVKLHVLAMATIRPHVAKINEAVENGRPAPMGRWTRSHEKPLSGDLIINILPHIRLMIDEILKKEYSNFMTKAERQALQADSVMLRQYSDLAVIKKLSGQSIFPTKEQRTAYRNAHMDPELLSEVEVKEEISEPVKPEEMTPGAQKTEPVVPEQVKPEAVMPEAQIPEQGKPEEKEASPSQSKSDS